MNDTKGTSAGWHGSIQDIWHYISSSLNWFDQNYKLLNISLQNKEREQGLLGTSVLFMQYWKYVNPV